VLSYVSTRSVLWNMRQSTERIGANSEALVPSEPSRYSNNILDAVVVDWIYKTSVLHSRMTDYNKTVPAISKPSLGAVRCLWPRLDCRIFTAHALCPFLSDVFMGGALGYSISRYTVLRE
jgi:hypothetical protein